MDPNYVNYFNHESVSISKHADRQVCCTVLVWPCRTAWVGSHTSTRKTVATWSLRQARTVTWANTPAATSVKTRPIITIVFMIVFCFFVFFHHFNFFSFLLLLKRASAVCWPIDPHDPNVTGSSVQVTWRSMVPWGIYSCRTPKKAIYINRRLLPVLPRAMFDYFILFYFYCHYFNSQKCEMGASSLH